MPRVARKNLESNYIHLITQGINKECIFEKDFCKLEYLKIIKEKLKDYKIEILAYCILDNHAHFLMHYEKVKNLSKFMHKVNTSYAIKYNLINNRKGYVFRDRYFSQSIISETQLINCMVYIHNNPVKANICTAFSEYRFSSYKEYTSTLNIVTPDGIALMFGSSSNYIEQFNFIHNMRSEPENIADILENSYSPQEIVKLYEDKYQMNVSSLIENEQIFGELLLDLRKNCGLSLRKMESIFSINKDILNKYIHKIIDAGKA